MPLRRPSVTRVGTYRTQWNDFVRFCNETGRDHVAVKAFFVYVLDNTPSSVDANGNLMINCRVAPKTITVQLINYDESTRKNDPEPPVLFDLRRRIEVLEANAKADDLEIKAYREEQRQKQNYL